MIPPTDDDGVPDPPVGVTDRWWREGFRLLRDVDASGLVSEMTEKRRRDAEKRAKMSGESFKYDRAFQVLDVKESIGDHYARQVVRPRVIESIVVAYWESLLDIEARSGRISSSREGVLKGLGRRLGMSEGTLSRWESGKSKADDRRVLSSVVVVIRKELDQVGFPQRRQIVWHAVKRTLEWILLSEWLPVLERRRGEGQDVFVPEIQEDGRGAEPPLTEADFSFIRSLVADRDSESLLVGNAPNARAGTGVEQEKTLLRLIRSIVGDAHPDPGEVGAKRRELTRLIDTWARPYVLFRIGLSQGWDTWPENAKNWEALDAEAV